MIVVSNLNDAGAGSLRQAIADSGIGEEITFSVTGIISLTSAALLVDQDCIITGPGSDLLAIVSTGAFRVFTIGNNNPTITGLEISGGQATDGAGIYNPTGTIILEDLYIHDCTASNAGGGIHNAATATMTNCRITANTGGGVFNSGTLDAVECSISANILNADGFQVLNEGTITLTRTTVSDDSTNTPGTAAIFNDTGTVTIANSTVSGHANTVAVKNDLGSVTFTNSTITNNDTGLLQTEGSTAHVYDTILAGNTTMDYDGDTADIISDGCNIYGFSTNPITPAAGDQFGLNFAALLIGPLQDNGGTTLTHALLPNSPALNAGDNASAPATDQRGLSRIVNGTIDIGAYEAGCLIISAELPEWITKDGDCLIGAAGTYSAATQEEANALAQAALDAFVAAAQGADELVCQEPVPPDPWPEPFAYYTLDSMIDTTDAPDSIGGKTLFGATDDALTAGIISNGFTFFDAVFGQAMSRNDADFNFFGVSWTVRFWAKPTVLDGSFHYLLKRSSAGNGWACYQDSDDAVKVDFTVGFAALTISVGLPTLDQWNRIVFGYDSGSGLAFAQLNNDARVSNVHAGIGSVNPVMEFISSAGWYQFDEVGFWKAYAWSESNSEYDWNSGAGKTYP